MQDKDQRDKTTVEQLLKYANSIIATLRRPFLVLDKNLRVISANQAFYISFKVVEKDTIGQPLPNLGDRQWNIPKLLQLLKEIIPEKKVVKDYEVEHRFEKIGQRVMILNARQVRVPQQAAVIIAAGVREKEEDLILLDIEDITGRRNIENGLEKARNELAVTKISEDAAREYAESIINTVREPLIALDQDLRVVKVSRSFYEFFKVKPEETVGQLIYDLGNKQWNIPKLRELLETILPQKASFDNYEVEHDFAGIGKRTMLLNARQIQRVLGKERIILLAIEDITERTEAEEELKNAKTSLEMAIDASQIGIWELDLIKDTSVRNIRHDQIFGYAEKIAEWGAKKFFEHIITEDRPSVQAAFDGAMKTDRLYFECRILWPDKSIHWITATGKAVRDRDGKPHELIGTVTDITERKEIERGLGKAHEELEDLTAELKRAAQAKSEFLANMSHELRTPLNSINGFSEVLYDETFGPLNEKQKKYVNNVLTSGKHLLLLINQILDTAKVEAGKMELALSSFSMNSLLNEISLLVEDMVSQKKLQMLLEIAEDLPKIEADELKIKEIIYNLLSNAVKFSPEGGKIGIRAKKVDSEIEIVVWDAGIGIAPENMGKIFEGFFRVDTPYSRLTEGTGLGLPLSRKLAELHGGKLSVESEGLNKGTSVRFTLPVISKKVV